jgi:hypothetical protein
MTPLSQSVLLWKLLLKGATKSRSQFRKFLKSVALWSTNIRKLAKDHKGYGSAAINDMVCKIDVLNTLSYKLKSLREKKTHRRVPLVEQELFTLSEHLTSWSSCYSILSCMCVFCRSWLVILPFFFWPLCCLFFDLRILTAPLVSSNSSSSDILLYATSISDL